MKRKNITRKSFITTTGLTLSGTLIGASALSYENSISKISPHPEGNISIQQIIELMIATVEGGSIKKTVDSIKIGNPAVKCTGVVSTFLATAEIIQQTAKLGANLIITHEPTFYNHRDETEWLNDDPVYAYKRSLLNKNNIVVFRFHDYWHRHKPDGILQGLLEKLEWEKFHQRTERNTGICFIPETSLQNLAAFFKGKMDIKRPFYIGDPELRCTKVGLLAGSWGPQSQMKMLRDDDVEVLVVGEVAEWETSEYVRDASYIGMKKGLIILGHAPSEAPGMEYLVKWLQPKIPGIPVYYEHTSDAFNLVDKDKNKI